MNRRPQADVDREHMAGAIRMATRGLGTTAPNPSVGAVVVDPVSGEILGRGWTQPGGRPHAEPEALRRAGARACGATLYVTLEPCSHHGKSPPCAEAIIAAGISRVVAANGDPDTRVSGRGFEMLRKAGIAVETGVLAAQARLVHAGHFSRVRRGRPFVQLKIAVSADGRVARGTGAPVWVTGPDARAAGHLMRARTDAILVGVGTVIADDPDLTCRLPGMASRSPRRIVLDSRLRIPKSARLLKPGGPVVTIVVCPGGADASVHGGASVLEIEAEHGRPSLAALLRGLAGEGVTRLMVEGGPTIAAAFLAEGLVDEVIVFQGARTIGGSGLLPFGGRGLDAVTTARDWQLVVERRLGEDTMRLYRRAGFVREIEVSGE